jgi:hypothetical protein
MGEVQVKSNRLDPQTTESDTGHNYPLDPVQTSKNVIAAASAGLPFERCTLMLQNIEKGTFTIQTLHESRSGYPSVTQMNYQAADDILTSLLPEMRTRLITDKAVIREAFCTNCDPHLGDGSLQAVLLLPLQTRRSDMGILIFGSSNPKAYSSSKIQIASVIADRLGKALDGEGFA